MKLPMAFDDFFHHDGEAVAAISAQLEVLDGEPDACRTVLVLLSHLAPEPIPLSLLEDDELRSEIAGYGQDLGGVLAELERHSLVRRDLEAGGESIGLDRRVQVAVLSRIPEEERAGWAEKAVGLVHRAAPGDAGDVRNRPVWEPLLPHALRVVEIADAHRVAEPTASLMNLAGLFLESKAAFAQAERLLRRSLAVAEEAYGENHEVMCRFLSSLTPLLLRTNRPAEAEQLLLRSLALLEASPDHPDIGPCLNNLAMVLKDQKRFAEAEPLLRRSLAISEAASGPDHPTVARELNNLASLASLPTNAPIADRQGLSTHAEVLLALLAHLAPEPIPPAMLEENPALLREAAGGELDLGLALADLERHSFTARDRDGDAGTFSVSREAQAAALSRIPDEKRAAWADRAVRLVLLHAKRSNPLDVETWPRWEALRPHAIRVLELAADHEPTGWVVELLGELGLFLKSKGLFTAAEPLQRRALALGEEILGEGDPDLAPLANNLAQLLQATGRLAEAEPLLRRALALFESGSDYVYVTASLASLAELLQEMNRRDEAEPLLRRALRIDEARLGQDHPEVARDLNRLAQLLQDLNRPEEAEPMLRRALAIDEAGLGPDHPNVAWDLNDLAQLLQNGNCFAEAETLLRRALAIDEAGSGPDPPSVARDLNNLSLLLQATGRLAEAEPLLRRALAIDEARLGPGHPNVATYLSNLAQLLQESDRSVEAEPLLRRALQISETSLGSDHPKVAVPLNNLAWLLLETRRFKEAESLLERALAILERSYGDDHPWTEHVRSNLDGLREELGN